MPYKFSMILYGIFEDFRHWNHYRRGKHQATRVEGAPTYPGRAPVSWAPGGPPPLMPAPTHFIFYPKNPHPAQARVLARFAVIFDLLAQSSIRKIALGDCCLVCDSSIGPNSFCSSALFIANFCCIGDHVLELACWIYEVPSNSNAWYRLKALVGVVAINLV